MPKKVARLFNQFAPENYQIEINIDPEKMLFDGKVTVKGTRTSRPSKRLTFHQKDLKITSASVVRHAKTGDQVIDLTRINNQKSLDEVRLHSNDLITSGDYTVVLDFTGVITKPMNGIYPCYFNHDGKDKKLIATQFESHHAREAFPCIDEPEAKATFDLTISGPKNQTMLSNTPIKQQVNSKNKTITTFETTPKMSSYLLAFVVGDLEYIEAKANNGVTVRCYATPAEKQNLAFSVDVAVKSLEFFENYFNVKYPLKKLDMVALPDFSSGAMENWGLITYRESAMLVNPKSTGVETKQHVALVIAHEMSHQWFGNLVTMRWWDDLWLNESFANMMEYRAIDQIFPEWRIFENFVAHEGFSAKRRDSLKDVQSVHCKVNHPDEISTLFDPSIVYAKGGTLLYMLMNYIGEADFKKGLSEYFNKHKYSNTVAEDLWQSLSTSSGKNISNLMENWLTKPGYPVVEVDWAPESESIGLSQQRFLSSDEDETIDTIWQVPLASNMQLSESLLTKKQQSIKLNDDIKNALILNSDGKSYFIPAYKNKEHLDNIISDIKAQKVSATDRLLLLDNYNLMQRAGNIPTTELIKLARAYTNEKSENVWGAISLSLSEAWKLIELGSKEDKKLSGIALDICGDLIDELGWEDQTNDSAQTSRLRGIIYSLALSCEDDKIIKQGLKMFRGMKVPADLPSSTRSVIYSCASRYGDGKDFRKLLELYSSNISADEKEEIASSLCSTRDQKQITKLIELLKSGVVRRQNLMSWYAGLLANRYSRKEAWEWLTNNWAWIEEQFASDKSFGYFARITGSVFNKPEELDKFTSFFDDKKDIVALKRDIQLATQEINSRVAWRIRNQDAVRQFLDS